MGEPLRSSVECSQLLTRVYFSPQGCLIRALDYFAEMVPHPILILVLSMEVAIYIFFIFLNTLAINRYILFIFWPMTVSKDGRKVRGVPFYQLEKKTTLLLYWCTGWEAGLEREARQEMLPKCNCVGSEREEATALLSSETGTA